MFITSTTKFLETFCYAQNGANKSSVTSYIAIEIQYKPFDFCMLT